MEGSLALDAPLLTMEQYLALPETNLPCELVEGRLVVTPPPGIAHQRALFRLARALDDASPADVEALPSPLGWALWEVPRPTVREPDIAVVRREEAVGDLLRRPPLIAVEILSPTSHERDLVTKREQYARAGLPWYWLVDLDAPAIAVERLIDGAFGRVAFARGSTPLEVDAPFRVRLRPIDLLA